MIVDVHAHAVSERFLADLTRQPIAGISAQRADGGTFLMKGGPWSNPASIDANLHDLPRRLESLTRRKVELQLFAPPPNFFAWPGGAATRDWVRALHAQEIALAADAGGLMEPMVVFALGEPEHVADELRRALDLHPFRAGMLSTTAGGRPLDDPVFAPMWSLIEERELLIFLHPNSAVGPERFGFHGMHVVVGWPFETTLAVTRLIFAGVLERHPRLKLIASHGGGNLVFLRGRLDAAYRARGWEANPYYRDNISRPPSEYLDRLYYDSCALSPESIRFLIDTMGADRVMFGSDYPFDIGDAEGECAISTISTLAPASRDNIYRDNVYAALS